MMPPGRDYGYVSPAPRRHCRGRSAAGGDQHPRSRDLPARPVRPAVPRDRGHCGALLPVYQGNHEVRPVHSPRRGDRRGLLHAKHRADASHRHRERARGPLASYLAEERSQVDLPTYTNIWRIEKRLYKLYDFRLPAPLPITWIGVFTGITVPYVVFLIAVGLPFNHNLVWLYVLPPGVLTWLTTRPLIESKRLPELVSSQLRYIAEPRTWCRMAPFAEKDEILVTARVWHRHPPMARPKRAKKASAKARSAMPELQLAGVEEPAPAEVRPVKVRRPAARPLAARHAASPVAPPPVAPPAAGPLVPMAEHLVPLAEHEQVPVQERAPARRAPQRANAQPEAQPEARPSWSPWPYGPEPDAVSGPPAGQMPGTDQPSAWTTPPPPAGVPDARVLEVAHDSDLGFRDLDETSARFSPPSWPSPEANLLPLVRPRPEPAPFPEAGPFPEVGPFPENGPGAEPDASLEPEPAASTEPSASTEPAPAEGQDSPEPGSPPRSGPWTGPVRR